MYQSIIRKESRPVTKVYTVKHVQVDVFGDKVQKKMQDGAVHAVTRLLESRIGWHCFFVSFFRHRSGCCFCAVNGPLVTNNADEFDLLC